MILYMYVRAGRGRLRKKALSPEQREPSVETFEEKPCLEEINLFSPTTITKSKLSHLTCIFLTIESPSLILSLSFQEEEEDREKQLHLYIRKRHCMTTGIIIVIMSFLWKLMMRKNFLENMFNSMLSK